MQCTLRQVVLATVSSLAMMPGVAAAQNAGAKTDIPASFRLSTGVTYSSGSYGETEDTEVIAIPLSLTYSDNGFKFRVSVPWVMIDGPGSLLSTPEGRDVGGGDVGGGGDDSDSSGSAASGSGSSGSSGSGSSGSEVEVEDDDDVIDGGGVDGGGSGGGGIPLLDRRRSGLGDVNIYAGYSFDLGGGMYLDPSVKLKLPTASRADRLGTGQIDVTTAVDLVREWGPATVYLHGRRKFAGKPAGSTVRSTWGAGGGISMRAADGVSVGADYDWQQSAFALRPASSEISAWAKFRLGQGTSLTAYAGTGLNANSADVFGGLTVGYRF